jgi:hypothetical protein
MVPDQGELRIKSMNFRGALRPSGLKGCGATRGTGLGAHAGLAGDSLAISEAIHWSLAPGRPLVRRWCVRTRSVRGLTGATKLSAIWTQHSKHLPKRRTGQGMLRSFLKNKRASQKTADGTVRDWRRLPYNQDNTALQRPSARRVKT